LVFERKSRDFTYAALRCQHDHLCP
jgi:hypothetical protein